MNGEVFSDSSDCKWQAEEQGRSGTRTKKHRSVCAQKLDMNSIKKVTKVGNGRKILKWVDSTNVVRVQHQV